LHLVGILFPHINEDARSKSHQTMHGVSNVKTEARNCSRRDPPCSRQNDKDCTGHTSVQKSECEHPRLDCLTFGPLCTYM